jgi:hypothetical protein
MSRHFLILELQFVANKQKKHCELCLKPGFEKVFVVGGGIAHAGCPVS